MMVQIETELSNHAHDDGKSYRNVVLRKLKADNVLNNDNVYCNTSSNVSTRLIKQRSTRHTES